MSPDFWVVTRRRPKLCTPGFRVCTRVSLLCVIPRVHRAVSSTSDCSPSLHTMASRPVFSLRSPLPPSCTLLLRSRPALESPARAVPALGSHASPRPKPICTLDVSHPRGMSQNHKRLQALIRVVGTRAHGCPLDSALPRCACGLPRWSPWEQGSPGRLAAP